MKQTFKPNVKMARLAKKLQKLGIPVGKPFAVKMLYEKEVNNYLDTIENAHKTAGKSKLPPFKGK